MTKACLSMALLALACPAFTVAASAPAAAVQDRPRARSYTVLGSISDADIKRLREALSKVEGVEQIELIPRAGGLTLRVRGDARPQALSVAATAVGFDLMPPVMRVFIASGPTSDADIQRLREVLVKAAESSQVQVATGSGGAIVRVRGDVMGAVLAAAAKSAGFALRREGAFVASGSSLDVDRKLLEAAVKKLDGVEKVELKAVAGGATIHLVGDVEDEAISAAAKSAGYTLRPLNGAARDGDDTEQITPPAPGERNADITKVGELAPDFTLVTRDGKRWKDAADRAADGDRRRPPEEPGAVRAAAPAHHARDHRYRRQCGKSCLRSVAGPALRDRKGWRRAVQEWAGTGRL